MVARHAAVKGAALQDAMQAQSWDPSVKALTAVPQTLQMMNDKLDWTQQLGDALFGGRAPRPSGRTDASSAGFHGRVGGGHGL
jgi:hypothetical protein